MLPLVQREGSLLLVAASYFSITREMEDPHLMGHPKGAVRLRLLGGVNSAGQAAVFYSGYAAEVVILVRGAGFTLNMSQYLIEQIHEKTNI
jgi:thioredoxin reductase